MKCNHLSFQSSNDKCVFAKEACGDNFFFQLCLCFLSNYPILYYPLVLLILIILFYLMSNTANKHLSLSLTKISQRLSLSQSLSAMTFLAFGNGSPDIMSSIIAITKSPTGVELSISGLIGSGIWITTCVFGMVIFLSKEEIKVNGAMFIREKIFYFITLSYLFYICWDGTISLFESITYISIYFMNLIVGIVQDRRTNQMKKLKISKAKKMMSINTKLERVAHKVALAIEDDHVDKTRKEEFEADYLNERLISNDEKEKLNSNNENENDNDNDNNYSSTKNNDSLISYEESIFYRIKRHFFEHDTEYSKMTMLRKIIFIIIELPISVLRDLSIPCIDEKRYNKPVFVLFPMFSYCFLFLLTENLHLIFNPVYFPYLLFGFLVSLSISITLYFKTTSSLPENRLLLYFINFFMSIIWMSFFSNKIIKILYFIGITLSFPKSILGLTLLSFGNSIPDATLDCSLAMTGYGEMAVTGTIAAPHFNLLLGLGISFIKYNLQYGVIVIDMKSERNFPVFLAFIVLIVNLITSLIFTYYNGFVMSKGIAIRALLIFSIYIIGIFCYLIGII